jgi:thioredoxin-related protein
MVCSKPGPSCQDGVYVYDQERRGWVFEEKSPFREDGYYVLYFDNTRCPACRKFDEEWFRFVEAADPPRPTFIIILCTWFAKLCSSEIAKRLFEIFDVHVSPTILFMVRENGKIMRMYKHEGVLGMERMQFLHNTFKQLVDTR